MRICFKGYLFQYILAFSIGIGNFIDTDSNAVLKMLSCKAAHLILLAVILLRQCFQLHDTHNGIDQRDRIGDEFDQCIHGSCQCRGQCEEHGQSTVGYGACPHTIDSPAVRHIVRHHSRKRQDHRIEIRGLLISLLRLLIGSLQSAQSPCVLWKQVEGLHGLYIRKRLLLERRHPCIRCIGCLIGSLHSGKRFLTAHQTDRHT